LKTNHSKPTLISILLMSIVFRFIHQWHEVKFVIPAMRQPQFRQGWPIRPRPGLDVPGILNQPVVVGARQICPNFFAVLSHNIVVSCEDFYRVCTTSHFRSAGWQPAVSPTDSRRNVKTSNALRIANPRYSRLPVCATLVSAPPRYVFVSLLFKTMNWRRC
jgi:hypothetical protein